VALEHRVAAVENYEITKSNDSNDKIVGNNKGTSSIVRLLLLHLSILVPVFEDINLLLEILFH